MPIGHFPRPSSSHLWFFRSKDKLFTFPISSISFPSYDEDGVIFTYHSVVLHIAYGCSLLVLSFLIILIFFSCKSLYFTLLIFPQLLEAAAVNSKFCGRRASGMTAGESLGYKDLSSLPHSNNLNSLASLTHDSGTGNRPKSNLRCDLQEKLIQ